MQDWPDLEDEQVFNGYGLALLLSLLTFFFLFLAVYLTFYGGLESGCFSFILHHYVTDKQYGVRSTDRPIA